MTKIKTIVRQETDDLRSGLADVRSDINKIDQKADRFLQSADDFITRSKKNEDEITVLRGQHRQMRNVLVKKNIASETDFSLL